MDRVFLFRDSLRPPTHRGDGSDLANGTWPSWVLLDFTAYVLDRRNSTTATCKFRGDKELQVTFFPAHPPRVSYFCVYCSGLKPSDYPIEPTVIATEANLVLLRIAVGARHELWCPRVHDYFIYSADGGGPDGGPLLEQLPHPSPYFFRDEQIGLLSYDTGGYTVVALRDDSSELYRKGSPAALDQYDVCILHSKDKVWTIKAVDVPREQLQQRSDGFRHDTSKVITIGGEHGTMAFVDLWRGILWYDVLSGDALLRYTLLPEISPGSRREYSVNPLFTRDIAFVEGHIKYVEMPMNVKTSTSCVASKAATWSMPATTSCQEDTWLLEGNIEVSKIRDDENLLCSELLRMWKYDEGKPKPTMESLHTGHPTLSLRNNGIVYFMTKVASMDSKACVIAVDMSEGTIQGVARFGAERTGGISFTYMHSRFSKYLKMPPGTKGASSKSKKKGRKFTVIALPSRRCQVLRF
ncbi:uncharacterized protein LOC133906889 [Phragmites australis]|uniref:uncharacterized protein LOC133906889 n=1 Tax=Phragmites australis TaxID=29695 RepID=UPI002D790E9A|nr:uncharacterized protein LOC133906889 [Phragmites australis]